MCLVNAEIQDILNLQILWKFYYTGYVLVSIIDTN